MKDTEAPTAFQFYKLRAPTGIIVRFEVGARQAFWLNDLLDNGWQVAPADALETLLLLN